MAAAEVESVVEPDCVGNDIWDRLGLEIDVTYKYLFANSSKYGYLTWRYRNYRIRCPLTCGHGSFYITQGNSLRAGVSSEQDSPIVRGFRKFNEVTGLSVDARVRVAAP